MPGSAQHLIVDGHNVLHAWPELHAWWRRDRARSRDGLLIALRPLHDASGAPVTVVFDGRGAALAIDHPGGDPTFTVVHSPAGSTADDVIERMVGAAPDPAALRVATSDRAERDTVEALGAQVIDGDDLRREAELAAARLAGRVREHNAVSAAAWRAGKRGQP